MVRTRQADRQAGQACSVRRLVSGEGAPCCLTLISTRNDPQLSLFLAVESDQPTPSLPLSLTPALPSLLHIARGLAGEGGE